MLTFMNRLALSVIALAIAIFALFFGSIGATYLSSGQGTSNHNSQAGLTTLTQTAVIVSTDLIEITQTSSTTVPVNSGLVIPMYANETHTILSTESLIITEVFQETNIIPQTTLIQETSLIHETTVVKDTTIVTEGTTIVVTSTVQNQTGGGTTTITINQGETTTVTVNQGNTVTVTVTTSCFPPGHCH
jgi:hypothetical protein